MSIAKKKIRPTHIKLNLRKNNFKEHQIKILKFEKSACFLRIFTQSLFVVVEASVIDIKHTQARELNTKVKARE